MDEVESATRRESKLWFVMLGRGMAALVFSILVIANPWMTLGHFAKVFAVYALVDSALALFVAGRLSRHRRDSRERFRSFLVEGILGAVAAIAAFALPAAIPLRVIGGLRAIAIGAGEVIESRSTSVLVELGGIVSVVLGILLLAWPGPGTLALKWLYGLLALVWGGLLFAGSMSHLRESEPALA